MQLWLLRPRVVARLEHDDPWEPWYDKCFGFVIRAETEEDARALAQDEGNGETVGKEWDEKCERWNRIPAWTDPKFSSCVPLTNDGDVEVIMYDVHAA